MHKRRWVWTVEVIAPACHQKKIPPSGNTNRAGNRILSDTRNTALDEKKKNAEMGKKRCEHGREPSRCKECGGSGICEHGRQRRQCKDCRCARAAADAQEKAAAALAAAAALESETAAPAPAAAPGAAECSECKVPLRAFVST